MVGTLLVDRLLEVGLVLSEWFVGCGHIVLGEVVLGFGGLTVVNRVAYRRTRGGG